VRVRTTVRLLTLVSSALFCMPAEAKDPWRGAPGRTARLLATLKKPDPKLAFDIEFEASLGGAVCGRGRLAAAVAEREGKPVWVVNETLHMEIDPECSKAGSSAKPGIATPMSMERVAWLTPDLKLIRLERTETHGKDMRRRVITWTGSGLKFDNSGYDPGVFDVPSPRLPGTDSAPGQKTKLDVPAEQRPLATVSGYLLLLRALRRKSPRFELSALQGRRMLEIAFIGQDVELDIDERVVTERFLDVGKTQIPGATKKTWARLFMQGPVEAGDGGREDVERLGERGTEFHGRCALYLDPRSGEALAIRLRQTGMVLARPGLLSAAKSWDPQTSAADAGESAVRFFVGLARSDRKLLNAVVDWSEMSWIRPTFGDRVLRRKTKPETKPAREVLEHLLGKDKDGLYRIAWKRALEELPEALAVGAVRAAVADAKVSSDAGIVSLELAAPLESLGVRARQTETGWRVVEATVPE